MMLNALEGRPATHQHHHTSIDTQTHTPGRAICLTPPQRAEG